MHFVASVRPSLLWLAAQSLLSGVLECVCRPPSHGRPVVATVFRIKLVVVLDVL